MSYTTTREIADADLASETRIRERVGNGPLPGDPGAGSYVAAVILPIVGIILGIVALAKNRVGPGLALMAAAWLAGLVWGALAFAILAGQVADNVSDAVNTDTPAITAPADTQPVNPTPSDNTDSDGDYIPDDIDSAPQDPNQG
jgi:hypothetical protein